MFTGTKTICIKEASIAELWQVHSDVANWAKWQDAIEWVKVDGAVQQGTTFEIKPKGNPKVKMKILEMNKPYLFKDVSYLPFATMEVSTYMEETSDGVIVKVAIEMRGFLTFLWKNVVAKAILEGHKKQYDAMLIYIQSLKK